METLLNFIWYLFGVIVALLIFLDKAVLLPENRKQIQKQFERWWKDVKKQNKLKFALTCATNTNKLLDKLFDGPLLSSRMIFRCFLISNGLLIVSLSWVGLVDKQPFGVTPWTNYKDGVSAIQSVVDDFINQANVSVFPVVDATNTPSSDTTPSSILYSAITNDILTSPLPIVQNHKPIVLLTNIFVVNVGTNNCIVHLNATAHVSLQEIKPIGHGKMFVGYDRYFDSNPTNGYTNWSQSMGSALTPYLILRNDALSIQQYVTEHNRQNDIIAYSVFYFVFMSAANASIFIISLIGCRVILREIIHAARTTSAIGLVFSNFIVTLFIAIVVLLIFTVLALPLVWLLVPALIYIAHESLYTLCILLFGSAVALWLISGTAAKVIALIGLMPSLLAIVVGGFSSLAIKWKTPFHWLCAAILNRIVKNGLLTVAIAFLTLISVLIGLLAKYINLTGVL